ncbi:MAG: hypothetical protein GY792_22315, partial [Gammaproteobacteria bacterium]|nr:hypothetical protein [Gammaproteobacteria bacterium]
MVTRLKYILLTALLFTSFTNAAPVITLSADEFSPGESVIIKIKNLPGNPQDWLTLVKVDALASKFGEWSYTKGVTEGTWTFSAPKRPGDYEVRVFFDYPAGGETIHARAAVKVIAKKKSQPQTTVQASKPESKTAPTMTMEEQNKIDQNKMEAYSKLPSQGNKKKSDQTTKQKQKVDTEPSTTESTKDSKPNQAVTSVLSAEDLDESTPSGKALATVHALLTPIGGGLGTAAQVMARIEPRGYKLKGKGQMWIAELNEIGGGQVRLYCGRKTCSADSEVTSIDYRLEGAPGTYELFEDLITKSQAYMRGRLGQET